jgi:hypothetical protein
MKEIKLFNNVLNEFVVVVLNVNLINKQLPYRLAYENFLIKNNLSKSQNFFNDGKLHILFDKYFY